MKLIALIGQKKSGKSEVAKVLAWNGFTNVKFAQPLKNMLLTLPGISSAHIEGHLKEEPCEIFNGKTVRYAMQTLGTEWGRDCIDQNIWLNLWKRQIKRLKRVSCDDCRFLNEAQAVKDMGGEIWEIRRKNLDQDEHSSETEMAKISPDVIVHNNGTLYDLGIAVNAIVGSLDTTDLWQGEDVHPRAIEGSDA